MKRAFSTVLILALLLVYSVPSRAGDFDYEKERGKLWEWLADKHADLGDKYKAVQIYTLARKQYDRARELEPDNKSAWKGLGYKKKDDKWVPDEPMPAEDGVSGKDYLEARKKPDEEKLKVWDKCADRCRKLMENAGKAGDNRSAKIAAVDLLYYVPDDAEARKLRGHVKDGDTWLPAFSKKWRDEGHKIVEAASFGEEVEGADPQAALIGATFDRRSSEYLMVRAAQAAPRAKFLHRNADACIQRAQALLGTEGAPFGGRQYTLTHLQTRDEYVAMLEKVLKLEGDDLEFSRKLNGHGQKDPYGYFACSAVDASADDMLCNTLTLSLVAYAQNGVRDRSPWVDTGFGYLVTSQVLGTTMVQRYTMKDVGTTTVDDKVIPEFTKKSGTPDLLREVALYDIRFDRDIPLGMLVATEINDMQQAHAAKSFSFMEFIYDQHPEQATTWLKSGGKKKASERIEALETAFGKKLNEIEDEWREWVLMNY